MCELYLNKHFLLTSGRIQKKPHSGLEENRRKRKQAVSRIWHLGSGRGGNKWESCLSCCYSTNHFHIEWLKTTTVNLAHDSVGPQSGPVSAGQFCIRLSLLLGLQPVNRLAGCVGEKRAQEWKTSKNGCESWRCCLLLTWTAEMLLSSCRKGSWNYHLHSFVAKME